MVLSASAKTDNPETLILNAGSIEHLSIRDNVDVVLLQGSADDQSIVLGQNVSDKLNLKLSGKTPVISAPGFIQKKQKVTIYVYVNNLKSITAEDNSTVKTVGALYALQQQCWQEY